MRSSAGRWGPSALRLAPVRHFPGGCSATGSPSWATVFPTDTIVRLDPTTGTVTATADVGGLYPDAERPPREGTPNGIAAVPGTDEFLVTGKPWPHIFRVRFLR
ncbi:glutaminyl-peptide cyclotransferase [Streptomyces sp. NPDC059593]|uniref:glutaminyl-peptide cyclotransferase n=1 Tax=Streptomyces sp. NPDC059593 TaxID=3346878 RepID=UPI003695063A